MSIPSYPRSPHIENNNPTKRLGGEKSRATYANHAMILSASRQRELGLKNRTWAVHEHKRPKNFSHTACYISHPLSGRWVRRTESHRSTGSCTDTYAAGPPSAKKRRAISVHKQTPRTAFYFGGRQVAWNNASLAISVLESFQLSLWLVLFLGCVRLARIV